MVDVLRDGVVVKEVGKLLLEIRTEALHQPRTWVGGGGRERERGKGWAPVSLPCKAVGKGSVFKSLSPPPSPLAASLSAVKSNLLQVCSGCVPWDLLSKKQGMGPQPQVCTAREASPPLLHCQDGGGQLLRHATALPGMGPSSPPEGPNVNADQSGSQGAPLTPSPTAHNFLSPLETPGLTVESSAC